MPGSINEQALRAAVDEQALEQLIREEEQTILREAGAVSGRYVTKSDDEWSVALYAFSRAVSLYDAEKGDFLPFARRIIRQDLIDDYRARRHQINEIPASPEVLSGNAGSEEDEQGIFAAVARKSQEAFDRSLKDEILAVNEQLRTYGFRFYDLAECSPKQERSRADCAAAIRFMLAQPALRDRKSVV